MLPCQRQKAAKPSDQLLRWTFLLSFLTAPLAASPCHAANFVVDRIDDEPAATACTAAANDCSLRGAIIAANTLAASQTPEASDITVPAGTYTLSQSASCTYRVHNCSFGGAGCTATTSQIPLCINAQVTIHGAGAATTIIDANSLDEVVFVGADAIVDLRGVTVTNGLATFPRFLLDYVTGGGIRNEGTLTVTDAVVTQNQTSGIGAGIYNTGQLDLLRTTVSLNVASKCMNCTNAGGIFNARSASLSVVDSTIRDNTADYGGGVDDLGDIVISGSTISGNSATTNDGGGFRLVGLDAFPATMTIVNSTISGNQAGRSGGGLFVSQVTTVHLESVTITGNSGGHAPVNGVGFGGGVWNDNPHSSVTFRNTVIAGNSTTGHNADDCGTGGAGGIQAVLTSEGHNLIGIGPPRDLQGDTTGDQVGSAAAPIDALLGPLVDNGGATWTHVLLPGSPAIDAANPAAPGSGGFACPVTDQRGVARPDGVACDIGALELEGSALPLHVSSVKPNVGGNAGSVLALVYGTGFVDGAVVTLTRAGETDVVGGPTTIGSDGTVIAAPLDLQGAKPGSWNVTVTNPDTTTGALANAFTVDAGGRPDLWVELTMPRAFVFGRITAVYLRFGNRGTIDAHGVPLWFSFPDELQFRLPFVISPPPAQAGQVPTDWSEVPVDVSIAPPANRDSFPLLLPVVPAGSTSALKFRLRGPPTIAPDRHPLPLTFDVGRPYLGPSVSPDTIVKFVERAKQYAAEKYGTVTFPPDATIEQYVGTQLASVLALGSAAAVSRVGATPPVYSLAQLVVDTGQFVAAGGSANLVAIDRTPADLRWLSRLVADAWLGTDDVQAQLIDPDCDPTDIFCERTIDCEGKPPIGPCAKDPPLTNCDSAQFVDDDYVFVPCNPKPQMPAPDIRSSLDPNDKVGPGGPGGFVDGVTPIPYTVLFENIKTATAAAQEVVVTDQLDVAKLDVATFNLGPINFGAQQVFPPPGLSTFTTDVDLRPGQDLLVRVDANLDTGTGIATWHFTALDPATHQLPEDPLDGFLPPNVTPPEGEGGVLYTISPKAGLALGTNICNAAHIVFDVNAPIDTPEWCNVIGAPEDCANCRDDDGDGKVDRDDPDCTPPPSNGGGAGLADPKAAKALDKCAKTFRKVGGKLASTRSKLIEACLKVVTDCVQLKPADAKCLAAARTKCGKAKTALPGAETKVTATIAKACGGPGVAAADVAASVGIGFDGEAGLCTERGVASVGTLADITECLRRKHACAAERLITAAVPRAAELLALGGWNPVPDLPCIDEVTNGGGSAVAAAKRKALRKCDLTIQKATAIFVAGRSKAVQACGAAVFTCLQSKSGDPGCLTKAGGTCTKAVAGLPKLASTFTSAIAKACGAAPLETVDLLGPEGLGAGALADVCKALGVPSLASAADVAGCLARQASCRADEMLVNQTPRLGELLNAGGVSLP